MRGIARGTHAQTNKAELLLGDHGLRAIHHRDRLVAHRSLLIALCARRSAVSSMPRRTLR
jgi:hypothetical protein